MKKGIIVTTLVAVLVLSASLFAFGPRWDDQQAPAGTPAARGGYAYRTEGNFEPLYQNRDDSAYFSGEDTTIEGTIVEVEYMPAEIKVETAEGIVEVHTGPLWMLSDVELTEGQNVVVEGKLVTVDDESFVVPSKITIDGTEIVLRDADGFPTWMKGGMMNQAAYGRGNRARGNYQNAPQQGNYRNAPGPRGNHGGRGNQGGRGQAGNCWR
ncbi:hypothetical protein AT15_03670 [Kosmotoga arenicorallina S304]|uniref:DUF5666 domain-containing protein n=1 Tax=Kosmotoga arenicorallina S304 TaxID=1453497 RepID=A0A176K3N9_9BACT|nr:hypothetical protein [Kosmotoga arenicorallina]OAA31935.1 hypothetical protein AT15_03670 [Kosmotoga arenicorallina S304]